MTGCRSIFRGLSMRRTTEIDITTVINERFNVIFREEDAAFGPQDA
jgi:hypothetical protein